MSLVKTLACLVIFTLVAAEDEWPCDKSKAIKAFETKNIQNMWPTFENNPYSNQTKESNAEIQAYLKNHTRVCALKYVTWDKSIYNLRDFGSKQEAEANQYIVTHQGRCGVCSNLKDLAVYLKYRDLTTHMLNCFMGKALIRSSYLSCLRNLGFTIPCAEIFLYNAIHTGRNCAHVCLIPVETPRVDQDGNLNPCIQCDEDESVPIYKYFAGRSRRNSGIESSIPRPKEQMYEMTHCYF